MCLTRAYAECIYIYKYIFLVVVVVGAVKIVNKNIWHPYFLLICMEKHHIEIRKTIVNNSVSFVKNLQKRVNKVLKTHIFLSLLLLQ